MPLRWILLLALGAVVPAMAQPLAAKFGPTGLASLSYAGTELIGDGEFVVEGADLRGYDDQPAKLTGDARSELSADGHEVTRSLPWGRAVCRYDVTGNRLAMTVSVTNTSPAIVRSLAVRLLAIQFPERPKGWDPQGHMPHWGFNAGSPTVVTGDFGSGVFAFTDDDPGWPLVSGLSYALDKPVCRRYAVGFRTTSAGWLGNQPEPFLKRPLYPGCSDRFTVSLRFGPAGSDPAQLVADVYRRAAELFPMQLKWTDRRPIGSLFISTSAAGFPKNPRGWLNQRDLDVTTPAGREAFASALTAWGQGAVRVLKGMNAQGMILWDPEGQEYPHATSYLGDPRSLPPEIEPLIDGFYELFSDAGLRVGCCVRPQLPVRAAYGSQVWQTEVPDPAQVLIDKIAAARKRWGCTLFYVDSNGDPNVPFDPEVFRRVAAAHPDVLLFPEQENLRYWAYTAPYNELRGGWAGTPATTLAAYPTAFSLINVADGPIEQRHADLVTAVRRGDILLFRGWYDDPINEQVKRIYAEAATLQ